MSALLCTAGADPPKHPQRGDKYNRTGYWESARLWPLQDELLQAMGLSWDSVVSFPAELFHSPIAIQYGGRIIEILRDEYADSELFCLKEPRISRLLPLWMPLLRGEGIKACYVVMTRNPLEVAQSLKRRNGFHWSKSLLLWLRHTLEAEHYTRGHRRVFVMYDQIMGDWRSTLQKISDRLDIAWPRSLSEIDVEFERIISDRLHHHRVDAERIDTRSELADWVASAYRACVAASEGEESAQLAVFDRLRREIETAGKAFEPLLIVEQLQRRESEERRNELARQAESLQSEATGLAARVAEREAELSQARTTLSEMESALAAAQARSEQTLGELGQRENELVAARTESEAARAEAAAVESQRAALQSEATGLAARVAEREAELHQARTTLSDMESALAAAQARSEQILGDLGQRENELAAARAELETARAELETARAELAAVESQHAALRSETTGLAARVAEREAELHQARTTLSEMESALAAAQARSEQILGELSQRENELAAASAELEAARAELEASRAELAAARVNAATAESQHAALQSEATGLAARVTERDAELAAVRAYAQRVRHALDFREAEAAEMRMLLALPEKARETADGPDALRESERRVAILSARTLQLNADLALNAEEYALEGTLDA